MPNIILSHLYSLPNIVSQKEIFAIFVHEPKTAFVMVTLYFRILVLRCKAMTSAPVCQLELNRMDIQTEISNQKNKVFHILKIMNPLLHNKNTFSL